jgi:general secretion pathway protein H
VSIIEIMIVVAIVGLMVGVAVMSLGAVTSARLKQATTQVAGATRIAYSHATAVSKVVRLNFDFTESKIYLEEAEGRHLVSADRTGGAEAANDIEAEAAAQAQASVLRAPKASFSAVDTIGFPQEGVELPSSIQFWQVQVSHQPEPIREGNGYLYFFPGGQTQQAAIQLRISNASEGDATGFMTVLVSPLTGKTLIKKGRADAPNPLDPRALSDLEEP